MKAVVCTRYGPPEVLQLQDMPKPTPKENEVLIRIRALPVTAEDPVNRRGEPRVVRLVTGLQRPKNPIPGAEFAGDIEEVGQAVTHFKPGDQVLGSTGTAFGCYAEYICMPQDGFLSLKPSNQMYEEAAPVCAAMAAWNFLVDQAHIQAGQKVLINGASGAVGTAGVQIAKLHGAEVTGVCSGANADLVGSLGADSVVDYTQEDFTRNGVAYDVIFDAVGKSSFARCKGSLEERGIYLFTAPKLPILLQMLWTSLFGRKKVMFSATGLRPLSDRLAILGKLNEITEAGKLETVVDREYKLEDVVEAHKYVEKGHKKGNVVITLD